jgi:hypothetical protein
LLFCGGRVVTRWGFRCMMVRELRIALDVPALFFNRYAWLVVSGRL